MKRRWPALLALALLLVLGGAVGWLYANPPLHNDGGTTYTKGGDLLVGLHLENRGRWPVVLTEVTVDGRPAPHPEAMAVTAEGAHLADNAIFSDNPGSELQTGPVARWQILPEGISRERRLSYAVRLDLTGRALNVSEVLVHYRYLGLPMRLAIRPIWEP